MDVSAADLTPLQDPEGTLRCAAARPRRGASLGVVMPACLLCLAATRAHPAATPPWAPSRRTQSPPTPPHTHSQTHALPCPRRVLSKLQSCNVAARKELDWVGQTEALTDARRLVAHHPELLTPGSLHDLCAVAAPAVEQLRSCTSRGAMQLFGEVFAALGARADR